MDRLVVAQVLGVIVLVVTIAALLLVAWELMTVIRAIPALFAHRLGPCYG